MPSGQDYLLIIDRLEFNRLSSHSQNKKKISKTLEPSSNRNTLFFSRTSEWMSEQISVSFSTVRSDECDDKFIAMKHCKFIYEKKWNKKFEKQMKLNIRFIGRYDMVVKMRELSVVCGRKWEGERVWWTIKYSVPCTHEGVGMALMLTPAMYILYINKNMQLSLRSFNNRFNNLENILELIFKGKKNFL